MLLRYCCGALFLILLEVHLYAQGIVNEGPSSVIYFPGRTQLPIELICNVTGFPTWIVNTSDFTLTSLRNGLLSGHNISGTNILVEVPVNGTEYICTSSDTMTGLETDRSEPAFLYVAAAPDQVPGVMLITNSISIDDDGVTLTLSWGEPFNNFDPIVDYTVSCSSDVTCPPDSTTTDNTTRSYTITNLAQMTNYTFSVVANNSIGSGEAGIVNITTPSLPDNVTGVMLTCEVDVLINRCTVEWEPITVGNGPLEQPLVYEVYYNGTRQNVTSPTTILIFTAPSLPDGVFVGNITVIVTAINKFGRGTPSDPDNFEIMSSSVTDVGDIMMTPNTTNATYSITVTCTIHADSTANVCEVIATASGQTLTSSSELPRGMTTVEVTVNGLACGVEYTITAGGTLNGDLIGLNSSHGTVLAGPCPPGITPTVATTTSMTATTSATTMPTPRPPDTGASSDSNAGAIGGGVGGGIAVAVIIIIIIIVVVCCIKKREKSSRPTSPGDKVGFRPASGVKVQTLDRYGKPVVDGDNTDTGVELTATSSGQPTTFQSNEYQTVQSDEKNRTPSAFMPEGSYDTLAPADEPPAPSAQVIPPAQNGQSNPNAPKLNYAELEQFTRKPASVKKPEPQPSSQYAVIDPKSLQGTYT